MENLVDARKAAEILGLSVPRVAALGRERQIPRVVIGPRTIRYRPADLFAYLRERDGSDGLLDSGDVSRILGITRDAVIRLVHEGELPASTIGSGARLVYRFDAAEVVRYVESRIVEAAS